MGKHELAVLRMRKVGGRIFGVVWRSVVHLHLALASMAAAIGSYRGKRKAQAKHRNAGESTTERS